MSRILCVVVFALTVQTVCWGDGEAIVGYQKKMSFAARFPGVRNAMLGYDWTKANPFAESGDPGWRNAIFMAEDRGNLAQGITYEPMTNCHGDIDAKAVSSLESYKQQMKDSSMSSKQSGWDFSYTVSATAGGEGAKAKVKKDIPIYSGNSESSTSKSGNMDAQFSARKSAVTVAESKCITQKYKLSSSHVPPFTLSFVKAVSRLASSMNTSAENIEYRRFVDEFGTHYSAETELGSKMTLITIYAEDERYKMSAEQMEECSKKSERFAFIAYKQEKGKSACKDGLEASDTRGKSSKRRTIVVSAGARPAASADEWFRISESMANPAALRMKLRLIANLFTNPGYDSMNSSAKRFNWMEFRVDRVKLTKFMVDKVKKSCDILPDVVCEGKFGCGYTDTCHVHEICLDLNSTGGFACRKGFETSDFLLAGHIDCEKENMYYLRRSVMSLETCRHMCMQRRDCVAFVHLPEVDSSLFWFQGGDIRGCLLYNAFPFACKVANDSRVAGYIAGRAPKPTPEYLPGYECLDEGTLVYQGPLGEAARSSPGLPGCVAACKLVNACKYFTYNAKKDSCMLRAASAICRPVLDSSENKNIYSGYLPHREYGSGGRP